VFKNDNTPTYWGWNNFGRTNSVTCRYECKASPDKPEEEVTGTHYENYYFWHEDVGNEGDCLGAVFEETYVDIWGGGGYYAKRRTEYGYFDPNGSGSKELEKWAKENCDCNE